ncbi:carbohydrate ABC transporter permease [Cohnella luojiensis]|uniref:Sugar ABC transporter permease n=1 Tax=Cohnella luojiensis TaxID=652876 RepID=A0A4Y8LVA5_9BACL|nr:sugar ABC transporter permease [Cohnella luojiensis]TFE22852.1 sugar ABC transporter permease [Cohnella luojiensis]
MKGILGNRRAKENIAGYSFMFPTIVIIGTFVILPILYALFLSFNKVTLLGGVNYDFVGLKNFNRMIDDDKVWISLKNTAKYVLIVVPCQTMLALILAAALNAKLRGRNFFRTVYFLPTITSSAVLTLIFVWILNNNGLLNELLGMLHFPTHNWLAEPAVALFGVMLMNIYSTAPGFMVIYLASMQDISHNIYESAEIDGANAWTKFWKITVPLLKPVTFFVVVLGVIGSFQVFDQAYIVSRGDGGPNNSTLTIVLLIYKYAFKNLDMGYASALALLLAIVIMLFTLVQRKLFGDEKN